MISLWLLTGRGMVNPEKTFNVVEMIPLSIAAVS